MTKSKSARTAWRPAALVAALAAGLLATLAEPAASAASEATGQGTVETEYAAVFMAGKKVGYAKRIRAVAGGKVTSTEISSISLSRSGVSLTMRTRESYVETVEGKPLSFSLLQDLGLAQQKITGSVDAAGTITVTTSAGGEPRTRTIPWPDGALMPEGLRRLEKQKGLAKGTRYKTRLFSPVFLQALDMEVNVGATQEVDLLGRVVRLTEVKVVMSTPTGKLEAVNYVDRQHKTLKTITTVAGMKMEIISCSKQFALSPNDTLEFFERVMLSSPRPLRGLRRARAVTYHLAPKGEAVLTFLSSDNQSVRHLDGEVVVTVRPVAAPKNVPFPYKGTEKVSLEALKSTRFIQSDDAKVRALARQATRGAADAVEAARRIESFVRSYIKTKNLSVGYASAAEVAASRKGDCTEHAVLAAAMCRSVGIPAQVVSGVVYVERFGNKKDIFAPHAWTRVRLAGKWVALDSAMRGYDAGHIAMVAGDGDLDEFFGTISTMGNFRVTKVEVER